MCILKHLHATPGKFAGAADHLPSGRAGALFRRRPHPLATYRRRLHSRGRKNLPLFVLGGGSNLVVSDAGWPGLVLKIAITGIDDASRRQPKDKLVLRRGRRRILGPLRLACRHGAHCAGVECLSGIPGSVGGTPVQNVGAYGQEVSETIESVEVSICKDWPGARTVQ